MPDLIVTKPRPSDPRTRTPDFADRRTMARILGFRSSRFDQIAPTLLKFRAAKLGRRWHVELTRQAAMEAAIAETRTTGQQITGRRHHVRAERPERA